MSDFSWHSFWDNAPGILAIALIFGGGMVTGVVAMIVSAWKANRESERLAILKQQMLDKGMSADEIIRVIQVGQPKE
jgi:hypothetical protein